MPYEAGYRPYGFREIEQSKRVRIPEELMKDMEHVLNEQGYKITHIVRSKYDPARPRPVVYIERTDLTLEEKKGKEKCTKHKR